MKLRLSSIRQPRRLYVRASKLPGIGDKPVDELPDVPNLEGLNKPESAIARALTELGIRFALQQNIGGGSILGGARLDFLLLDYRINIEFQGPQHATTYGRARDVLRNIGVAIAGYEWVPLYEEDLHNLKKRILEAIGRSFYVPSPLPATPTGEP